MELHSAPPLTEDEQVAVQAALARAGVHIDGRPESYRSSWRRAAVREAVDAQPTLARYARSPRSTRGATRA
jgi:hypothetical protein